MFQVYFESPRSVSHLTPFDWPMADANLYFCGTHALIVGMPQTNIKRTNNQQPKAPNILRVPPKHTIYQNLTLALDIAFAWLRLPINHSEAKSESRLVLVLLCFPLDCRLSIAIIQADSTHARLRIITKWDPKGGYRKTKTKPQKWVAGGKGAANGDSKDTTSLPGTLGEKLAGKFARRNDLRGATAEQVFALISAIWQLINCHNSSHNRALVSHRVLDKSMAVNQGYGLSRYPEIMLMKNYWTAIHNWIKIERTKKIIKLNNIPIYLNQKA